MYLTLHSLVCVNGSIYGEHEADRLRADICDLSSHQIANLTHIALGYAHNLAASGSSFNASRPESNPLSNFASSDRPAMLPKIGAIDARRAFLGCVSVLSA